MFSFKKQNKSGFTLIETIVALVLGALIIGVIMSVVISGTKQSRSIKRTMKLHSDIAFLIDNLNYLIKQGQDVYVPLSGDFLTITFPDSATTTIKVDDQEIKINDDSFTDKDIIDVKSLSFTPMANSVRINISLEAKNNSEKASISTTIAYRN